MARRPLVNQVVVEVEVERGDVGDFGPDDGERGSRPVIQDGPPPLGGDDPKHPLVDREHALVDQLRRLIPYPLGRGVHGQDPGRADRRDRTQLRGRAPEDEDVAPRDLLQQISNLTRTPPPEQSRCNGWGAIVCRD